MPRLVFTPPFCKGFYTINYVGNNIKLVTNKSQNVFHIKTYLFSGDHAHITPTF